MTTSDIDVAVVYDFIQSLLHKDQDITAAMNQVIDFCRERRHHHNWRDLRQVDYAGDLRALELWLRRTLKREPPSPSIRVFWFGLNNPSRNGKATADIYLSGAESFYSDVTPGDWDWSTRYAPKGDQAQSSALDNIYQIAYQPVGQGNDAEYCLGLA